MTALDSANKKNIVFLVIVAALGYFVDIYDLVIFSIVRLQSFKDIGVKPENMRLNGEFVLNMQMGGLLLGGILWGIIGDKFGRIKVLFGSILLYSIANFLNGLVHSIEMYGLVRFAAGIGLAGELGAGITLVSETISKKNRGYGTMMVAVVGLFGAAVAATVAKHYTWQMAYFVGGGLGFLLLLLRAGTFESGMFKEAKHANVSRGNMLMLFTSRKRFFKYLYCILIGAPLWYVVGILVTQAPEIGKALHATTVLSAGTGILYTYFGIAAGDLVAGLLAQFTKSRKLTMMVFHVLSLISVFVYLQSTNISAQQFIWLCLFMGFSCGYWATFVTIASEQFGTNIRATVTTTVPNFVRGALIPITYGFEKLVANYGIITSARAMMVLLVVIAFFSINQLKESFGKDLDYMEDDQHEPNSTTAINV
ncbi:MFS transporter [Mucilaginibacter arboris]|uniref:MFS transporter n=1 Tax=Mucilaginibacter arboris TaxID=2682090 RepID=A0A7K1SZ20_9SPHI|nr:MFS transporter [Mucilaginibacter arboris]MVN22507.1 MFS transporter [Mucilaginibacter arboris]